MKHMKFNKIIAAVLACALVFSCTLPAEKVQAKDISAGDWMSEIDGSLPISCISIPGTHDSATQYITPAYFLQCQNTDFATQLNNGYRYLDIRLALDEEDDSYRLKFIHNFGDCRKGSSLFSEKLYLEDCLDTVYTFLEDHPTETVILNVKAEDDGGDLSAFQETFYQMLDENPSMWYTENTIPVLDDVRGKIVLCTRFDDVNGEGSDRTGLHLQWEEQNNTEIAEVPYETYPINDTQSLWVEDRYKYNMTAKYTAVKDMLENCQADENTLSLCFSSTSGSGTLSHPSKYAKYINEKMMGFDWKAQTCYGIVIVDFANADLAEKIYMTNFK